MTDWVVELDEVGAGGLDAAGGKAVNLGILLRAGFPVPDGFCVTTAAYREVAPTTGDAVSRRDAILATAVPPEIEQAIRAAYDGLGTDVAVAVRSSATAEDLGFASFAGQQDTYLEIVGPDAVVDAVRRCWASLWTDRAWSYRETNEVDQDTVALAVVVQRMVDAKAAGVLFTANPVTGRRNEAVIDAAPGLGEAVVSGSVNPDHFVVDTASGAIHERTLVHDCLTDEQVRALATLGGKVQDHYGSPQDTEWALDAEGKLWLTQARPITTLYPIPPQRMEGSGPRIYLCGSLAQGLTRPITPMGLAGIRLIGTSAAEMLRVQVDEPLDGPAAFTEAGQRFFIDLTPAVRSTVGRAIVPRIFDVMEARSAIVLRQVFDDPHFSVLTSSRRNVGGRIVRFLIRGGAPVRALAAIASPSLAHFLVRRNSARLTRLLVATSRSATGRLDFVERLLRTEVAPMIPRLLPVPAVGFAMMALARKVLGKAVRPGELQTVLRGLPHNVTTEMDLELWSLAQQIRGDESSATAFAEKTEIIAERYRKGILPKAAQDGLTAFLAEYGHRAVAEIDLGLPRWSEDPAHIIGVLTNYLRLTDPALAPDLQFKAGTAAAEAKIAELALRVSPLQGRIVRFALHRTRELAGLREAPKFLLIRILAAARRELRQVGAELVAAGRLDSPTDVFFLDLREIRSPGDLRLIVAERRASYEQEVRRRRVPRLIQSDGVEPETLVVTEVTPGALVGSPASAGTVTAKVRVILEPTGAHLEPGEILVAPSTDPGWTPLFLTAGGLVMEMGGANSHGAVVAREYGIPAVVAVPDATTRLQTGDVVTIDGAAGTITKV
ncbi:phosphoenolpyruvate synthase [Kribbella antibiotica]|uniref:Phosphoenolpyruvate synthase n=1 Tax=Kribbella antibiotica TaxID=190195 RepID=A0A4R4ZG48_9ACTN|nr:PEP/pyruvate-binding domain-containing protein [Kribbella antibiotica]TDD57483.1 phosphoenolpyruvate synthase [Kribbella antibiotica]